MSRWLIAPPERFTINGYEFRRKSSNKGRDSFL
jgi:hypothetical protein